MSRTKGCKKGGRQIYGREITKKKSYNEKKQQDQLQFYVIKSQDVMDINSILVLQSAKRLFYHTIHMDVNSKWKTYKQI